MPKSSLATPLLLDTHCWIWMQLGMLKEFTPSGIQAVRQAAARGSLRVSVISVWEVGMLEVKGRIRLQQSCAEWVQETLTTPGLSLAPLTPEIALASSRLPGEFHGDPADRILLATARQTGAHLMTRDTKILDYGSLGFVRVLCA